MQMIRNPQLGRSMMTNRELDEKYMKMALDEAKRAGERGEGPVGAILLKGDRVLAKDHNRCIELSDPTAHAEILVLRKAGEILGNYRLNEVEKGAQDREQRIQFLEKQMVEINVKLDILLEHSGLTSQYKNYRTLRGGK